MRTGVLTPANAFLAFEQISLYSGGGLVDTIYMINTKRLDTTPRLFPPEKAEALAHEMGADDPDWTYTVDHDPKGTGYSRISVADEDGEFIAFVV